MCRPVPCSKLYSISGSRAACKFDKPTIAYCRYCGRADFMIRGMQQRNFPSFIVGDASDKEGMMESKDLYDSAAARDRSQLSALLDYCQ